MAPYTYVPFVPNPQSYYEHYSSTQHGKGMPFFKGMPVQHGYGLGGLISSLLKSAFPFLKSAATSALKTGAKAAIGHIGQKVMEEGKRRFANSIVKSPEMTRRPLVKRTSKNRLASRRAQVKRRRRHSPDIFD